jgi:4-hydroxy-tetrahydrodipicolinate reductase
MVRLVITGIAGKVGSTILKLASTDNGIEVTGGLEAKNHPLIGTLIETSDTGAKAPVADSLAGVIEGCDVVIDFTEPKASMEHFRIAAAHKKAIIVGTTGFSEEALREMKSIPGARAVISPNMSVGMNLMFDMVEKLSRILKTGYDVEIVEMHHRLKKDAPSGTAVKLMEVIEAAQPDRDWTEVFGRKGIIGQRKDNEIGVLALRGGDIVGEHTVMFAGIGERLEVTHRAYSRENFARGAIVAAKWIAGKDDGIYTMKEVLGLA